MQPSASNLGILNPQAAARAFRLERLPPAAALAPYVERYWSVRWKLPAGETFTQETLSHPALNLVIEAHRAAIHGVNTRRFAVQLRGDNHAFGVKFRPGGFAAFWPTSIHRLTDRATPLSELSRAEAPALTAAVRAADDATAKALLDDFLVRHLLPGDPRRDHEIATAVEIVQLALRREVTTVADLARKSRLTERALQRLFRRYVGVGPKWVLRRLRLHLAAERIAAGAFTTFSALAAELGYSDQAHFSNELRAFTGKSPADYAAWCSAAMAQLMGTSPRATPPE